MGLTLPSLTMRKMIILMMLVFPAHALAAMSIPSDILQTTAFTSSPRSFEIQAHNEKNGVYYSAWIDGSQEGKGEWYKAKMDVTLHMQNGTDSTKLKVRLLVYQHTLYAAIVDGDNTQWTSMPIDDLHSSHGLSIVELLPKAGIDVLNINKALNELVHNANAQLSVTHTGYATGNAYSLKTPNIEHNTHIRVNTDKGGQFGYLKIYTTNGKFVAEGSTQPESKALYLGIPSTTISYDEFKTMLGVFRVQTAKATPKKEVTIIQNKNVTTNRANRIVHADRSRARPRNIPTTCGEMGTLDRVELDRKGYCPTERFHKRIIHGNNEPGRDGRRVWEERVNNEKLIRGYNDVALQIEEHARRRNMHNVKARISRTSLQVSGSDIINDWITNEIIPFFVPTSRSWVVDSILLEDEYGNTGVALQKSATTSTGKRKHFVIFLVEEDKGDQPVMTDIYLNTRISDLQANGLID